MEPEKRQKRLIGLSEETHDMFLTVPWSVVHFLSGTAVKALGGNFWTNFLLHGAYELKDQGNTDEVYNSMFNRDFFTPRAEHDVDQRIPVWIPLCGGLPGSHTMG